MAVTKKQLTKNVSQKLGINDGLSLNLINFFVKIIKLESSKKKVKLSNFGTFYKIKTKKRIGRNPKNKESHIIQPTIKLKFNSSAKLRGVLN